MPPYSNHINEKAYSKMSKEEFEKELSKLYSSINRNKNQIDSFLYFNPRFVFVKV